MFSTYEKLKKVIKEYAKYKYENYKLHEEYDKIKRENNGLKIQLDEVLKIDLDNFDVIQNKADQYSDIYLKLKKIYNNYKNLDEIATLFQIQNIINDINSELSHAVDNFQRLKIGRHII